MTHRTSRIKVEKSRSTEFLSIAENFREASELAFEFGYFNAAGVLIVHSVIALADALTIRLGGVKCKGENHYEIVSLMKDLVPDSAQKDKALNHFNAIIDHKSAVSYSGEIYKRKDIETMMKHGRRFSDWAKSELTNLAL
ncbi:MAG TPA: HEPN domain-containing protein [Ignavibacteriaceae bacterium]|nr:HEPN domain-containing protein [Ignavibacteriaceae bacterium]HPO57118.1 HEPN domain-containing protein [Ignavibacteriaceae bacterium]